MEIVQNRRARLRLWIDQHCAGSQAQFVSQTGINQGELSGLLRTKSFGEKKARSLEGMVGMPSGWLDQPMVEGDTDVRPSFGPAIQTPLRPVVVVDSDEEVLPGMIAVPRYTVKASAGYGEPVLEVDLKGQPNYCRSGWAQRNGYKSENLFSIVAIGDSMEPTIPTGASMIVHRQQEIVNGKVHVICRGDECYVKRLFKQMDGSVLVRSDNQAVYKDTLVYPDDPDVLHVVGLVVSVSFNL
ncbi:S24 family peptidase [Laribacter hongkongensis]|uniref:S24 family peptidase n=1 Tax=Laribacter hongkongensis TaxID=168471 RepID=UPI001EFEE0C8|nr:S24 family peptidase [Laribacter hongkongensis]MCG9075389.1 S24 family peptidase [Laribacter hongkongensis]